MKKVLVTGGAGFIGSNFIRYFLNEYNEYTIINLDLLTYAGSLNNLHNIEESSRYMFVKGDIADKEFVNSLFAKERFNIVINFAAESHVDRSIESPDLFIRTNINGTQALLEASKNYNIEKYIQISTDEVYGSLDKGGFFTEETAIAPNSPYSASKASADLLCRSYFKTYGLPINITRCSNNYGPYQFPEKLIPLMILKAKNNEYLPIYGDGLQIRDWLHVEDHCRAIDTVIHKGKVGEVYNIGGNNEKANIDIVKQILRYLDKPTSLIEFVTDRPGHDRRYAVDASKICKELGWKPLYKFEEGLMETIEWYINNNDENMN